MDKAETWQDPAYLRGVQYADSSRLAARANLHAKYGRGDWFAWLASQVDWPAGGQVLELGCGAGWFWASAAQIVPAGLALTLTDLSEGMVAEAVGRARSMGRWTEVEGRQADASALPFADASFDVVMASHMLYHLPDPRDGAAEIARVLAPGGVAAIATNGLGNLRELFDLGRVVFGGEHGDQVSAIFGLENGQAMLEAEFETVQLWLYPDRLVCTDPADILNYLTSSPPGDTASAAELLALRTVVEQAFAAGGGTFTVSKEVGVFLCRGRALSP
jgi:SAM-dependent methyltransferase